MKIYVVGSCQAIPLADCLAAMSPGIAVERFPPRANLSALVTADDVVFRQREGRAMTSAQRRDGEILYPRIWFNAFHPDIAYTTGRSWGRVPPPLGGDHSSLVLYGWHRGMSVSQTMRLFCEPVFERAGFFGCWDAAKRALFAEGEVVGFPLDTMFARLEPRGCFMRTPNHPALIVIAEIARELARRAALPLALDTPEYYLEDPMLYKSVWPVYPEIARRFGFPGGYGFKLSEPPSLTTPTLLDLEEFIVRAFEAYGQSPPEALVCPRLENPGYRDLESVAAGERKRPRGDAADREQPAADWREYTWFRDFEMSVILENFGDVQLSDATMDPLEPASMHAPVEAALPDAMTARTVVTIPCTVRNDGDVALVSGVKHPVFLCYRWYDAAGSLTEVGRSIHTSLPDALQPGDVVTLPMRVAAPHYPGHYRLRVALLQSQVAWFDDVDPANGIEAAIAVAERTASSTLPGSGGSAWPEGSASGSAVGASVRTMR